MRTYSGHAAPSSMQRHENATQLKVSLIQVFSLVFSREVSRYNEKPRLLPSQLVMHCSGVLQKVSDKDRPDEAFTTDRAVRAGRANAASGRIMVTIPGDHFGPIPPEADPRGQVCRVTLGCYSTQLAVHWHQDAAW